MGAPPAQYEHCVKIYNAMLAEASEREIDGATALVYEGYTTKLFEDLPQPYYTTVMHKLQAMHCVIQMKRGGGTAPSQWALLKEPDEEDFREAPERFKGKPTVGDQRDQQIRDALRTIRELTAEIESWSATVNLRLDMIEVQIKSLAKEVQEANARHND